MMVKQLIIMMSFDGQPEIQCMPLDNCSPGLGLSDAGMTWREHSDALLYIDDHNELMIKSEGKAGFSPSPFMEWGPEVVKWAGLSPCGRYDAAAPSIGCANTPAQTIGTHVLYTLIDAIMCEKIIRLTQWPMPDQFTHCPWCGAPIGESLDIECDCERIGTHVCCCRAERVMSISGERHS